MVKSKLPKNEVDDYKRKARDIIQAIAEPVMKSDRKPTKAERYTAIVDAWSQVKHFPISSRYLYMEIARFFDFETHESIWRICESYRRIKSNLPDKGSLAGYFRTWELIFKKQENAA